jgi:GAF domain-containing protein
MFEWQFRGQTDQVKVLAEPLRWHGETVGVLAYERVARRSDQFSADDRSRLAKIAALCAAALAPAQADARTAT